MRVADLEAVDFLFHAAQDAYDLGTVEHPGGASPCRMPAIAAEPRIEARRPPMPSQIILGHEGWIERAVMRDAIGISSAHALNGSSYCTWRARHKHVAA